jgi:hypothetical protein
MLHGAYGTTPASIMSALGQARMLRTGSSTTSGQALVDEPIVNKHIATIKELEEKIASQCVALADRLPLVATADRSELITRKPYE